MPVKYGKFKMPKAIATRKKDVDGTKSANSLTFTIEPFERGFGHTIGNSLRRVLLTALEAPAIILMRMEGILHKFTAVDGILEDVIWIALNVKKALLRYLPDADDKEACENVEISSKLDITAQQIAEADGQYVVRLKDVIKDTKFEVLNPELPIFTVVKPFAKTIFFTIGFGRGYLSSDSQNVEPKIGELVLDALFSPVRLVNYYVENTRVGQDTDFDRLVLDITTDGRVTPGEALDFAVQILQLHLEVFASFKSSIIDFDKDEAKPNKGRYDLLSKLSCDISEIELSVRSANCLQRANINTIGDLVLTPQEEILKYRNFW